jgi:peroxiredoxin
MASMKVLALAGVLGLAAVLSGCSGQGNSSGVSQTNYVTGKGVQTSYPLGHRKTAPVISGKELGGQPLSLSTYAGKVVVLNFWASWCVPCATEAPMLQRAEPTLRRYGATVLGVTYKDATPDSEEFVRRYHLTYPNLRDGTGSFAGNYGTDQLPESFIVDRYGHVVMLRRGEISQQFVDRAIELARSR